MVKGVLLVSAEGQRVYAESLPFTFSMEGNPYFTLLPSPAKDDELHIEIIDPRLKFCGKELENIAHCFDCFALVGADSAPNQLWTIANICQSTLPSALIEEIKQSVEEKASLEDVFKINVERIDGSSQLIYNAWNFEERELLKRAMLSFGYGRWAAISLWFRDNCAHGIRDKEEMDIRSHANSLMKSIADNLTFQYLDLKVFLLGILQQPCVGRLNTECFRKDPIVFVNSRDWDLNAIRQRAKPWARRLQLMYKLNVFVESFQNEYYINRGQLPKDIFDYFDILDNISDEELHGQRPGSWWGRLHDTHLLLATYLKGYTNYNYSYKLDTEIPLCVTDPSWAGLLVLPSRHPSTLNDLAQLGFPTADSITRRLKKLTSLISEVSNLKGSVTKGSNGLPTTNKKPHAADDNNKLPNIDAFTDADQLSIIEYLRIWGPPLNSDGKPCFDEIRAAAKPSSHVDALMLENYLQTILFAAFLRVSEPNHFEKPDDITSFKGTLKPLTLFSQETAQEFLFAYTLIRFVRRLENMNTIIPFIEELRDRLVAHCRFHVGGQTRLSNNRLWGDLIRLCNENSVLLMLKHVKDFGFYELDRLATDFGSTQGALMNLLYLLAEHILSSGEEGGVPAQKKRKGELRPFSITSLKDIPSPQAGKKAKTEMLYQLSQSKSLSLPLELSHSLRLLNLGVIIPAPGYHSEHNIYPVGFRTVRQYSSMHRRGGKAEYTCEILDAGEKPLFAVTSSDDPNNPIVRESPTACWIDVVKVISELSEAKRVKAAISGTERFGLLDPVVSAMIEQLPGVEECVKYIRKNIKP